MFQSSAEAVPFCNYWVPLHAWFYTSSRSRTGFVFLFTVFFSHWKTMIFTEFGNVEGLEKIGGLNR